MFGIGLTPNHRSMPDDEAVGPPGRLPVCGEHFTEDHAEIQRPEGLAEKPCPGAGGVPPDGEFSRRGTLRADLPAPASCRFRADEHRRRIEAAEKPGLRPVPQHRGGIAGGGRVPAPAEPGFELPHPRGQRDASGGSGGDRPYALCVAGEGRGWRLNAAARTVNSRLSTVDGGSARLARDVTRPFEAEPP